MELDSNIEYLYKSEPPVAPVDDGFGYYGVVLRNKITDKIQCHVCGKWYEFLLSHVRQKHKVKPREYRKIYGISMCAPLTSRRVSAANRNQAINRFKKNTNDSFMKNYATGKKHSSWTEARKKQHKKRCKYGKNSALYLNKRGICKEQLKRRLIIVSEVVGRDDITIKELREHDMAAACAVQKRWGGLNKFRKTIGWETHREQKKWGEEVLIGILRRKEIELGRLPREKDLANTKPSYHNIISCFGSWNRARSIAFGLDIKPNAKPGM